MAGDKNVNGIKTIIQVGTSLDYYLLTTFYREKSDQ